jgi:hypothetical protein
MSVYTVKQLVMRGNWDEGFEFYGPFDNTEDAQFFIDGFYMDEDEERLDADPERVVSISADLLTPQDRPRPEGAHS